MGQMNTLQTIEKGEIIPQKSLDDLVAAWTEYLDLEYSKTTSVAYLKGFRVFNSWLADEGMTVAQVRPSDIRRWREYMHESYAAQTVNLWLSAVRRFFAFLIEEFNAPILNPAREVRGVKRGKGGPHKRDELTSSEVRSVLSLCDDSALGRRDEAILSLMAYCAVRTVEIQRADIADLQTKDNRTILWIRGKGHEEADDFVVLPSHTERVVRDWLKVRKKKAGPLFWSLSRQNRGERLSSRAIRGIVKDRFANAGVLGNHKTTHSLRHSAITNAIRQGAQPLQVQAMARHRSFDTTLGYYHEVGRIASPAEDMINYSS
jgi:site-specific recombinase XerD